MPDYCTPSGANALAEKIRQFWSLRGFDVRIWVETANVNGSIMPVVRSDMVNGMPQRGVMAEVKAA